MSTASVPKIADPDGTDAAFDMAEALRARASLRSRFGATTADARTTNDNGAGDAAPEQPPARKRYKPSNGKGAVDSRRQAERTIRAVVDGRSLKATGRTAQLNFMIRPDLKADAITAAKAAGMSLAAWLEWAIQNALLHGENSDDGDL